MEPSSTSSLQSSKSCTTPFFVIGTISIVATVALGILGGSPVLSQTFDKARIGLIIGAGVTTVTSIALFAIGMRKKNRQKDEQELFSYLQDPTKEISPGVYRATFNWTFTDYITAISHNPKAIQKFWGNALNFQQMGFILQSPKADVILMELLAHLYHKAYVEKDPESKTHLISLGISCFKNSSNLDDKQFLNIFKTLFKKLHELDNANQTHEYDNFIQSAIESPSINSNFKLLILVAEYTAGRLPFRLKNDFRVDVDGTTKIIYKPTLYFLCFNDTTLLEWLNGRYSEQKHTKAKVTWPTGLTHSSSSYSMPSSYTGKMEQKMTPHEFYSKFFPDNKKELELIK